jgi:hypothetical protein
MAKEDTCSDSPRTANRATKVLKGDMVVYRLRRKKRVEGSQHNAISKVSADALITVNKICVITVPFFAL